jgi:hypothetical protein
MNSTSNVLIPPGIVIPSESNLLLSSQIRFVNSRPTNPLPPLVQTNYYSSAHQLQVCAVIFLDASNPNPINPESITVYYDDVNIKQPTFYITYNAPETQASVFIAYQVNFVIALGQQPGTIESIVWDIDPKASRGTITTVQSA